MKQKNLQLLVFTLVFMISTLGKSQLNKSYLSANYRYNFQSNFINLKFELGTKKTLNFFSFLSGINFSTFNSAVSCPYDLFSLNQPYSEEYINYESNKFGYQFSLGYSHHFRNLENRAKIFPYLEVEAFWYRIQDDYLLNFKNRYTDIKTSLPFNYNITTYSCETGFGLYFEHKKLLTKLGLNINYYWPVINQTYNPIERSFDDELPFVGVLFGIHLGLSYQLF